MSVKPRRCRQACISLPSTFDNVQAYCRLDVLGSGVVQVEMTQQSPVIMAFLSIAGQIAQAICTAVAVE